MYGVIKNLSKYYNNTTAGKRKAGLTALKLSLFLENVLTKPKRQHWTAVSRYVFTQLKR